MVIHSSFDRLNSTTATTQNYISSGGVLTDTNVTTRMAYDALGHTTVITDALGHASTTSSNGLGQTTRMTDTVGRVTRMGYDGNGALRWTKRNDGQITLYQVDGLGRTVTTIVNYQDGTVASNEPADRDLITRTVYDAAGRRTHTIDPAGRATALAYNNLDRLIAVTEHAVTGSCPQSPCNVVTQYQYDRAGNRTAIIDANGHVRRFTYDAANQPAEARDALNQVTSWDYDAGGRVATQHDPRGITNTLTYSYDNLDRLTQQSATNLGTIGAQYDALGRRTALTDGTGTTSFGYDGLSRMRSVQAPTTGNIGYGYDARGNRTRLTYPDGTTLSYGYWADGQLQAVTNTLTLASYSYDTAGRLAQLTRANGATTAFTYDGADRLRDLRTTVGVLDVSRFQYTVDRLGLRTQATETLATPPLLLPSTRVISYAYDGLLRLTGATESPGTSYAYAYDTAGNRTGVWVNGTRTLTQTFNAANQVDGFTYDAAGNLTNDGTATYSYDPLGRMTGRGSTTYTYNGDGVLVDDGTTRYTQDLAAPLSQVVQTTQGSTTTNHLYGLNRLASVAGSVKTWYGADALGSVRQTLSDVGTPLSVVNYDPWGTPESGSVPTFGFTGELQDVGAGLVNLRARWYATGQGRFVTRDPFAGVMARPQTLAQYPYAENDPANRVDPSGKMAYFISGAQATQTPYDDPNMSMWQMAREFAPLIKGPTFMAASGIRTAGMITNDIRQRISSNCGDRDEPIILVGYSLGGRQVMDIAQNLQASYFSDPKLNNVQIDLLVTIDANPSTSYQSEYAVKAQNVKRHINIFPQIEGFYPWDVEIKGYESRIPAYGIREIEGAENHLLVSKNPTKPTDHFSVDDRTVDRRPDNEYVYTGTWAFVRDGILDVMRSYQ